MAKRIIRLACITEGPEEILLDNSQRVTKIGRGDESDVVIKSPYVSDHHCKINQPRYRRPSIVDLGSRNGTFVDGKKIKPGGEVSFDHGSYLSIGPLFYIAWFEKNGRGK